MSKVKKIKVLPDTVFCGDSYLFKIVITVGTDGITKGDKIFMDFPGTLGWSRPDTYFFEVEGYIDLYTSAGNVDVKMYNLSLERARKFQLISPDENYWAKYAARLVVVEISNGELMENQEIIVEFGANTYTGYLIGSKVTTTLSTPGKEVQNFLFRINDSENYVVPVQIFAREPETVKAYYKISKKVFFIVPHDRFFNIAHTGKDWFKNSFEINSEVKKNEDVYEVKDFNVKIKNDKLLFYHPVNCENVYNNWNIYFGDLHLHTSYSIDVKERERMEMTPEKAIEFMRKYAVLDFCAITDHHQPWDERVAHLSKEEWESLIEVTNRYTKLGEFVSFPGFEFRGNLKKSRGDTCVILGENVEYKIIDDSSLENISKIWSMLRKEKINAITIPHFHNKGSLNKDEWFTDKEFEPILEIFSCHGRYDVISPNELKLCYMKQQVEFREDRTLQYFLKNGYRYGVGANSDGHKGHPGLSGLTAVFAEDLSRESILDALRNKRCYATTNGRIKLLFLIDGNFMGKEINVKISEKLNFELNIESPIDIKYIEIISDKGIVYQQENINMKKIIKELNIINQGENWYYLHVVLKNREMAWSSPIWVNYI